MTKLILYAGVTAERRLFTKESNQALRRLRRHLPSGGRRLLHFVMQHLWRKSKFRNALAHPYLRGGWRAQRAGRG